MLLACIDALVTWAFLLPLEKEGRLGTHEKQLKDISRAVEEALHTLGDIRASLKSHETILKQHTDAMTKAFEMIAKQEEKMAKHEEKMAKHEEKMADHELKMLEMGNDYVKAMDNLIEKIDKIGAQGKSENCEVTDFDI